MTMTKVICQYPVVSLLSIFMVFIIFSRNHAFKSHINTVIPA